MVKVLDRLVLAEMEKAILKPFSELEALEIKNLDELLHGSLPVPSGIYKMGNRMVMCEQKDFPGGAHDVIFQTT